MKNPNHIATFLLLLFIILFFTPFYTNMNVYLAFGITLSVSLISLCIGIYSLFKLNSKSYSMTISVISFLLLLFTIFVYLLPEAGTPPLIRLN